MRERPTVMLLHGGPGSFDHTYFKPDLRVIPNPDLHPHGMALLTRLDILSQLPKITCPTLVCVGSLDPITPVEAAREMMAALRSAPARLEMLEGAGHFPWRDAPDRYWSVIREFMTGVERTPRAT